MRRIRQMTAGGLTILLCILLLAGCAGRSYDADRNTVFTVKKGQVVSTDVGSLPAKTYDSKEFEKYVNKTIKAYTDKNGEDTVKLIKLSVENDVAKLTLEYASPEDYTRFTGIELFSGTVADAMAAGYDFDVGFVNAKTGKRAHMKDILDQDSLQVVIIKGKVNISTWDDVAYYSSGDNSLEDERTLAVGKAGEKAKGAEASTEKNNTEDGVIAIVSYDTENSGVEETIDGVSENTASSESIGEDELLTGTEGAGRRFVFDRPQPSAMKKTEGDGGIISDNYTYVIY